MRINYCIWPVDRRDVIAVRDVDNHLPGRMRTHVSKVAVHQLVTRPVFVSLVVSTLDYESYESNYTIILCR